MKNQKSQIKMARQPKLGERIPVDSKQQVSVFHNELEALKKKLDSLLSERSNVYWMTRVGVGFIPSLFSWLQWDGLHLSCIWLNGQ
jgi:hypothetical protein